LNAASTFAAASTIKFDFVAFSGWVPVNRLDEMLT